ncbi:MAG: DUF2065 domain-containing protein [Pseudomonadota bacterium]
MKFFICVMGMVMIVEGLPYFAFPGKMKEMVNMLLSMEETVLRRFGLALMMAGLFIVYLAMAGQ